MTVSTHHNTKNTANSGEQPSAMDVCVIETIAKIRRQEPLLSTKNQSTKTKSEQQAETSLSAAEAVVDQATRLFDTPAKDIESHDRETYRKQAAKGLKLSIIIPVFNERATIRKIVEKVREQQLHHEIIIVDDCSMDGTREILCELASEPDIRVLLHDYNQGKGAALRTGFERVKGDVVLIQDADLEYNPNDYDRLLEPIRSGEADVVYGSRFLKNAKQDPSRFHRFGNWLLTAASNVTTGQKLTDMETCYKVFRRRVLYAIDFKQNRFGFEPEVTAKVSRLGYTITEVPIHYNARGNDAGKKIGVKDALSAFWCILRYAMCD